MSNPPYNPHYPQQGIGVEHYQQGAPPPYTAGPNPYPPGQGPYGPPPGQYGPPPPGQAPGYRPPPGQGPYAGPYGSAAHYPASQNPQTVYVYEERRGQKSQQQDDTCLAMMAGACAMCLCCSLLSD